MVKPKKNHWVLKLLVLPFKIIFKIIYYLSKGIWWIIKMIFKLIKITYKKIKKSKNKPSSKAEYSQFQLIKENEGSLENFNNLLKNKGKIGIIIGGRGTGKSAIGMRILENLKTKDNARLYAWGFNEESIPSWINPVNSMAQLTNNSYVLIDESGISFSSRNSMSELNKLLTELLLIARHKNISIIFIAQNSSNMDINILRQADYLILKPHSLLQLDFERKIIKEIYEKTDKDFKKLKQEGLTYIYSDAFRGFITNNLPSFWSEKTSKGFSESKIKEKKN